MSTQPNGAVPISSVASSLHLSIPQVAELLPVLWNAPKCPPILLIGPPGGGKTSVIGQIAAQLGRHYEVLMGNTLEPSDVNGIPHLIADQMQLAPPAWAMRTKDRSAVINFDELNTARPATLAALLRVILERRVGDVVLGDDVHIIATMNPAEEAAHGWELPPAVANRFLHIFVSETSVADWQTWALAQPASEEFHTLVREFPLPYLYSKPDSGPFASPRSWTFALEAAARAERANLPHLVQTLISAAVGVGNALSWQDARQTNGAEVDWATVDPGRVGLIIEQKISEVCVTLDSNKVDAFWASLGAIPQEHFATLYVLINKHKNRLQPLGRGEVAKNTIRAITAWAKANEAKEPASI